MKGRKLKKCQTGGQRPIGLPEFTLPVVDPAIFDNNNPKWKAKPYSPSPSVKKAKAMLAGASLVPYAGIIPQWAGVGADLETAGRYALDGQFENALEDLTQAGIGLLPNSKLIRGMKSGSDAAKTLKTIKGLQVTSDVKTMTELRAGGAITNTGYLPNSPDRFNEFNIIPSNQITMKSVKRKIKGIDNLGNEQMMYPGQNYTFPGSHVLEIPQAQHGGIPCPRPGSNVGGGFTDTSTMSKRDLKKYYDSGEWLKDNVNFLKGPGAQENPYYPVHSFDPSRQVENNYGMENGVFPPQMKVDYTPQAGNAKYGGTPKAQNGLWHNDEEFGEEFNAGILENRIEKPPVAPVSKKNVFGAIGKFIKDNPAQTMNFGMGLLGNSLAANAASKDDTKNAMMLGSSDNLYNSNVGSRGDWTENEGFFQPDQKVPTQFSAIPYRTQGVPTMQDGGFSAGLMPGMTQMAMPQFTIPRFSQANEAPIEFDIPETRTKSETSSTRVTPDAKATPNEKSKFAFDYYKQKGLAPHIAAGIVGNLFQESRLKTDLVEEGNTGNGRGVAQWDVRDRWPAFLNWASRSKKDPNQLTTQLDYIIEEPGEGRKVMQKLQKTSTPEEATYVFGETYERPSKKFARYDVRTGVAKKLFDQKFQEGGEYEMDEKALKQFLRDGGQVEYLN